MNARVQHSCYNVAQHPGLLRGLGGPRANRKSGAHKMDCVRGGWDSTCIEVCSGAPESLFCECTEYTYTCKLPSLVSGFKLKSTTYGALAIAGCAVASAA